MLDVIDQFRDALRMRNLVPPEHLLADGKIHRCKLVGGGAEFDGSYMLHLDGIPAGGVENWTDGLGWKNWHAKLNRPILDEERREFRAHVEARRLERMAEERRRKAEAQKRAMNIWDTASVSVGHPYLAKKGLGPVKVRLATGTYHQGEILVPMRDSDGTLHSLQFIDANGGKHNLPGGRKAGCYFTMGRPIDTVYIAEGFATGASIYEATGKAVAMAFDAGNLAPVAWALSLKYPDINFVICADDDFLKPGNPGLTMARKAAQSIWGRVVQPVFSGDRPTSATDFNDMHQLFGLEAVKRCIEGRSALEALPKEPTPGPAPEGKGIEMNQSAWPELLPLRSMMPATEYPIDALPPTMRGAVEEVLESTQAPIPLAASSALCVMSMAIQPYYDIQRAEKLDAPVGVFLLTIAKSGERKSSCDSFFMQVIREHEAEQFEAAKPLLKDYRAALKAWEAIEGGINEGIRNAAKTGKNTQDLAAKLRDHEHEKPESPKVPRLIYADTSTEKLTLNLAKTWPSAGIVSSEGGAVFGAYGMNQDSVMRTLSAYDTLWDGGDLATDRISSESYLVHGARLTIGLQVQEETLRAFLRKAGELPRGIGFLARCLIAWPESTIGSRLFKEPSKDWPRLQAFNRRIQAILEQPVPIGEDGGLTPTMLELTPEAKAAWEAFFNKIETQLGDGGAFRDVCDVGSKIADNAVRIAALFHILEGGHGALLSLESVVAGCRVAEWHLTEARRFFGELALPVGLANAAKLETWLVKRCRAHGVDQIATKAIQQYGPNALRDKAILESATQELEDLGRIARRQDGKRKSLAVHPVLLQESPVATAILAIPAFQDCCGIERDSKGSKNSGSNSGSENSPISADSETGLADTDMHQVGKATVNQPIAAMADWDNSQPVEV